jgi:excisionase family DNA binding protein
MNTPTLGAVAADQPNRQQRRRPDHQTAVLDRHDTACYLGIGLSLLAELTAQNRIPSLTIGRRRLYRLVDLDAWLEEQVRSRWVLNEP